MTKEKVRRFKKYRYKWFQISIDGATRERHDEFRQKKGSWDAAIKAVFMLSNAGIPVTVAHSVTPENLNEIDDMCRLAYELGASGIILGEIMQSGRSYDNPDIILNHEQKNIMHESFIENAKKYSGRMRVQRSQSTKIQLIRNTNIPGIGAVIRPNGDIRLDCVAPFVIGNVLTDDFLTVWRNKANDIWNRPEVIEYINSWEDIEDINHGYRNYFDSDIRL